MSTRRSTRHSGLPRRTLGAILCAVACWGVSCGPVTTAFDGGTIPSGAAFHLFGQVENAAAAGQPIAGASVAVSVQPATGNPLTAQLVTDSNGVFDFGQIPAGAPPQTVTATITPSDMTFKPETISFNIGTAPTVDVAATLAPAAFHDTSIGVLAKPAFLVAHEGQPAHFTANLVDANGNVLPLAPTLVYIGPAGTVETSGTFSPSAVGAGEILALWYSEPAAVIQVTIDNKPLPVPPPPPVRSARARQ